MNLSNAGLNWKVKKVPISGTSYFNLIKDDNGYVLGNCTAKYEITQNLEFIKNTLASAFDNNFNISNYSIGKVDKAGKSIFVKINTGKTHTVGSDVINENITIIHHHDGRPIMNQSFCSYKIESGLSFNISMIASKNIDDVTCLKCASDIIDGLKKFSGLKITNHQIEKLVDNLINPEGSSTLSPKKLNLKEKLIESIGSPQNVWEAFKGVINYAESIKTSKDRHASMFTGSSAKMIESAFSYLNKNF